MTDVSAPTPIARFAVLPLWLGVAMLLALYAGIALSASTYKGVSFDEAEELVVGYDIWQNHDFRMEGANGDFVKRWATLPYLLSRPTFPDMNHRDWREAQPYILGYDFFFLNGNWPEWLLLQGRAMMVVLGVATGLLIFVCSKKIFGNVGGLISLGIFALSPHMLAFGSKVSTEMPMCLSLLGSTWCVWRLLHRATWARLLGSLVFFALLVLAKPSALVILPITAVLLAVKLVSGRPLSWGLGKESLIRPRLVQMGIFGGFILLHALVGWAAIWAHYDFRFNASPNPADPGIVLDTVMGHDLVDPRLDAFLAWSREAHFLPQGFIRGARRLLVHNDERDAFMDGDWKIGGWRIFFPYALWVKTSPALLLLLFLGLSGWWWLRRRARLAAGVPESLAPSFYEAIPYATLIAVYFLMALEQNLNIGHRHILPIYPAFYVLGGSIGLLWAIRGRWLKAVIVALFLVKVMDAYSLYPNYLAYFSPFVGGPAEGYKRLVDSSLDWGMDLPALKHWSEKRNPGNRDLLFLAYFGTDSPQYYGIKCTQMPSFPDWMPRGLYALKPGIYAISATLFQSVYTVYFGPWNKVFEDEYQQQLKRFLELAASQNDPAAHSALMAKYPLGYWEKQYRVFERLRFARLCAWLRHHREPDDNVGYSILIWGLSEVDLRAALLGPPAELEDAPVEGWVERRARDAEAGF